MRRSEPLPQFVRTPAVVSYRAGIGAVLGFFCAVAIIAANAGRSAFFPSTALHQTLIDAWRTGGLLGGLYLPVANALFLPKTHRTKMIAVAAIAAIIFGVVGDAAIGPWAPASVSASLGFWLVTFAMYDYDRRSRSSQTRGSYLP